MLALLTVLLTAMIFLLPLTLRAEAAYNGKTTFRATLRFICFTRTWQSGGQPRNEARIRRRKALLHALRSADTARHILLRHIRLDRLDVLILLHTGDAAGSALLTGGLQGLARIPALHRCHVRIRILPDFFRGQTTVQARGIIHIRVGILIVTIMMLLAQGLQQKARTEYGTSHW